MAWSGRPPSLTGTHSPEGPAAASGAANGSWPGDWTAGARGSWPGESQPGASWGACPGHPPAAAASGGRRWLCHGLMPVGLVVVGGRPAGTASGASSGGRRFRAADHPRSVAGRMHVTRRAGPRRRRRRIADLPPCPGSGRRRRAQATRCTVPGGASGTTPGCSTAAMASTPEISRGPGRTTMLSASIAHTGRPGSARAASRACSTAPGR